MNENELTIDEIRQICNEAIDYLQVEGKKVHQQSVNRLAEYEKKSQEILSSRQINLDFFDKIGYAIRFAINIFAVFLLRVDHRMVDYKTYIKQTGKQEPAVHFGPDTFFQRYNRVIGEIPNTLENARTVINSNDQNALIFYRWLLDVAYNNIPIWQDMFNSFKAMNVKETYNQEDLKTMLEKGRLSSPDFVMEKGLRDLLDNIKLNRQSGMAG